MTKSAKVNFQQVFQGLPVCYSLLSPELDFVAGTDAYFEMTGTNPKNMINRNVFDVFGENSDTKRAEEAKSLSYSLGQVLKTKAPHVMPALRYDIKLPEDEGGVFVTRWWRVTNSPIFGPDGDIAYIVNSVEDISSMMAKLETAEEALGNCKLKKNN